MARLIPSVDPQQIELRPERDVAVALIRDLPDDCIVYHSYCWLKPDRDHTRHPLKEGEADFLILDPRFGLLVIEVKGGEIDHRVQYGEDHYFRRLDRGGERPVKNPFAQGRHNLHEVTKILDLETAPWFAGCYGYAVVFPDCTLDRPVSGPQMLPHDAAAAIVMYAEHLEDLDVGVRRAFTNIQRRKNSRLSAEAMTRCQEGLKPVFRLITAKWRHIKRDDEALVQLTKQQQLVLTGLQTNKRLAVRGGAGTGKTMLALSMAQRSAEQGRSTLFLCFNSGLATWLNGQKAEWSGLQHSNSLLITTFHSLCRRFYKDGGIDFSPPRDSNDAHKFWTDVVPNTMFDFLLDQVTEPRFDCVIVDEGQDFGGEWWMIVESMLRNSSSHLFISTIRFRTCLEEARRASCLKPMPFTT